MNGNKKPKKNDSKWVLLVGQLTMLVATLKAKIVRLTARIKHLNADLDVCNNQLALSRVEERLAITRNLFLEKDRALDLAQLQRALAQVDVERFCVSKLTALNAILSKDAEILTVQRAEMDKKYGALRDMKNYFAERTRVQEQTISRLQDATDKLLIENRGYALRLPSSNNPDVVLASEQTMWAKGQRVYALKSYRERTGATFSDAKMLFVGRFGEPDCVTVSDIHVVRQG